MGSLLLTLAVNNAPTGKALGIKEAIAMDLEKYGDVTVLQVETQEPEQLSFNNPPPAGPPRPRPGRPPPAPAVPGPGPWPAATPAPTTAPARAGTPGAPPSGARAPTAAGWCTA